MKKTLAALSTISLLLMMAIPSAANGTTWVETYGGPGYDQATAIVACSDGGYAIAGSRNNVIAGYWSVWLIRLNAQRETLWNKTYGSPMAADICEDMIEVSSGGFILVGRDYNHQMWIVRTDSSGEMMWNKSFYNSNVGGGHAYSVYETADGGFILSGHGKGEGVLLRIDSNGNQLWNRTCSNKGDSYLNVNLFSVIENSAGEIIAVGYIEDVTMEVESDLWMIVTDANGNVLQNATLDNAGEDRGYAILELSTGGYLVAGTTTEETHDYLGWLVYYDSELNTPWTQTFDAGEYNSNNNFYDVVECGDGGFAVCGRTDHHDYDSNIWLVRTDSEGNLQWMKDHGDAELEIGNSLTLTPDGDFMVAGYTRDTPDNTDDWMVVVFSDAAPSAEFDPTILVIVIGAVAVVIVLVLVIVIKRRR